MIHNLLWFSPRFVYGCPVVCVPMFCARPVRLSVFVLMVLTGVAAPGCVRRRLTIRSHPPGARVFVDNFEIGRTPCATDFLYYGNRQIRLIKDGYETVHVKQAIPAPWYQIPPLDFFSENLVPSRIRDERTLDFVLTPQAIVPTDQLLSRADGWRQGSRVQEPIPAAPAGGAVTVPPPSAVPPTTAQPFAPPPLPPSSGAAPQNLPLPRP